MVGSDGADRNVNEMPTALHVCRRRLPRLREQVAWLVLAIACCAPVCEAGMTPETPRAAVYSNAWSRSGLALLPEIVARAQEAGYAVEIVDTATLTNNPKLSAGRFDLLALPSARELPADSVEPIQTHLKSGGDLLALGLPMWESALFQIQGRWISKAEYERILDAQRPQHLLENFEQANLTAWTRASDRGGNPVRHELAGADSGRALHVVIGNLTGWETFQGPRWASPFPTNHTLTCFRARGGPDTPQLSLEWIEQDGSRWIAVVDLSTNWQSYALPPEAFKAWQPPPGRGGRGDRLNVRKAVRFTLGLAHSHTAILSSRNEYWFDELGTAPNPFGHDVPPAEFQPPRLESLCPGYQFYPMTGPVQLRTARAAGGTPMPWASGAPFASVPGPLAGMHPRPGGVGYRQGRLWRWQPLIEAWDGNGDYRGAVAALIVHSQAPFRGSVWAGFTPEQPEFYRQPAAGDLLRAVLASMRRGVYLLEGGSEFFTMQESATNTCGARVANFSALGQSNLTVHIAVRSPTTARLPTIFKHAIEVEAGDTKSMEMPYQPTQGAREEQLFVTTTLEANRQIVDMLEQELNIWQPATNLPFLEIRDGSFQINGHPWKAHGVNYLPSSGIGINSEYFEFWLGRGAYDPSVIQRDLQRIRKMGLNAVSVFIYHRSLDAGHLFDFLLRCERLNLRVNLSLRPGTPMDFRWAEMKALIEHYRLASNTTVFAYDLAWEPSHYDEAYQRKHYTADWNAWLLKRHGNLEAARVAWGFTPAQFNPVQPVPVPAAAQLTQDGPWRIMAADYRAFLDELVGGKYAEARRLVKSIDPNHPVSFRMQFSGDPTHNGGGLMPYDFHGLSEAVDIWQPEAYGRIGDWEKVKPGHFTAAYARLCNPNLPVMWAEMGYSVWDQKSMAPQPAKLEFTARYYADFYRMLTMSGADGVFFWWYPGGYRLNEQSDYGIINPDGTDRPVTKVIRSDGARWLASPKPPPPATWMDIDRDRDARGLFGVYESVKEAYWQAIERGQYPGLKWSRKPGFAK